MALLSTSRVLALLAEIRLEQGDVEGAIQAARAAVGEAGEQVLSHTLALRILASTLLAAGETEQAEAAIREELTLLDSADWDLERIHALGMLVRILDAQRRVDESAETMDRARALIAAQPPGVDLSDLEAALQA
jgi:ATP/maltotriose-dependent transcriptional regulator MalT